VRNPPENETPVSFAPAEATPILRRKPLRTGNVHRKIEYDVASGVQRIEVLRDEGLSMIEDIGVETGFYKVLRYRIHPADPTSARAEADYELIHRHAQGWNTTVRTRSAIASAGSVALVWLFSEIAEAWSWQAGVAVTLALLVVNQLATFALPREPKRAHGWT
jgi:hypothetical protein